MKKPLYLAPAQSHSPSSEEAPFDVQKADEMFKLKATVFPAYLLLLAALAVALPLVSCLGKDWKRLHELLYARKGVPLGPAKTFQILRELRDMHANATSVKAKTRLRRFEALIIDGELSEAHCERDFFFRLITQIAYNSQYRTNLLPYLEDCKRRHFEFCKATFGNKLASHVGKLTPEVRSGATKLLEAVHDAPTGEDMSAMYLMVPPKKLRTGLIRFIEERYGKLGGREQSLASPSQSLYNLRRVFENSVGEICDSVIEELDHPSDVYITFLMVYNLFKLSTKTLEQVEPETMHWVLVTRLCRDVLLDRDLLVEELHKHINRSLRSRLLNCFTRSG